MGIENGESSNPKDNTTNNNNDRFDPPLPPFPPIQWKALLRNSIRFIDPQNTPPPEEFGDSVRNHGWSNPIPYSPT